MSEVNSNRLQERVRELELAIKQKDKIINSLIKSLYTLGCNVEINNNKGILTVEVRPQGIWLAYSNASAEAIESVAGWVWWEYIIKENFNERF